MAAFHQDIRPRQGGVSCDSISWLAGLRPRRSAWRSPRRWPPAAAARVRPRPPRPSSAASAASSPRRPSAPAVEQLARGRVRQRHGADHRELGEVLQRPDPDREEGLAAGERDRSSTPAIKAFASSAAGQRDRGQGHRGDGELRHQGHRDLRHHAERGGSALLSNQNGTAVYQDGTWKVGDVSFCGCSSWSPAAPCRPPALGRLGPLRWPARRRQFPATGRAVRRAAGRPGASPRHPVHAALPDLPRQHRGQRGARRHPGQPEGERDRPAVGRRRLRPHLRQHHAGLRDDRGRTRPEEGHAGRGRGLLRRLGPVRARPERPDAHRRAAP